jgi:hypothetical protein
MSHFANTAVGAFPEQGQQMPSIQQVQQPTMQMSTTMPAQEPLPRQNFIKPVSSSLGIQANTPGYYILQTNPMGQSQYIYYGTEAPKF